MKRSNLLHWAARKDGLEVRGLSDGLNGLQILPGGVGSDIDVGKLNGLKIIFHELQIIHYSKNLMGKWFNNGLTKD